MEPSYYHKQEGSLWLVYAGGAIIALAVLIELLAQTHTTQFTIVVIIAFCEFLLWSLVMTFAFKYLAIEDTGDSLSIYFGPLKYVFCGCQSSKIKYDTIVEINVLCDKEPNCCFCGDCCDCDKCPQSCQQHDTRYEKLNGNNNNKGIMKSKCIKCCSFEDTMGVHFGISTKYYAVSKWLFYPCNFNNKTKQCDPCKMERRTTFEIIFKEKPKCCCYKRVVVTTDDKNGLKKLFELKNVICNDEYVPAPSKSDNHGTNLSVGMTEINNADTMSSDVDTNPVL